MSTQAPLPLRAAYLPVDDQPFLGHPARGGNRAQNGLPDLAVMPDITGDGVEHDLDHLGPVVALMHAGLALTGRAGLVDDLHFARDFVARSVVR